MQGVSLKRAIAVSGRPPCNSSPTEPGQSVALLPRLPEQKGSDERIHKHHAHHQRVIEPLPAISQQGDTHDDQQSDTGQDASDFEDLE